MEPSARDGRTTRESPRRAVARGQQRDGTGEFAPGGHECPIRPRPLDRRPERSSLRSNYSVSTALMGRPRADTERARRPGAARTRRRRGSWSTRRESSPTVERRDSTRHRHAGGLLPRIGAYSATDGSRDVLCRMSARTLARRSSTSRAAPGTGRSARRSGPGALYGSAPTVTRPSSTIASRGLSSISSGRSTRPRLRTDS